MISLANPGCNLMLRSPVCSVDSVGPLKGGTVGFEYVLSMTLSNLTEGCVCKILLPEFFIRRLPNMMYCSNNVGFLVPRPCFYQVLRNPQSPSKHFTAQDCELLAMKIDWWGFVPGDNVYIQCCRLGPTFMLTSCFRDPDWHPDIPTSFLGVLDRKMQAKAPNRSFRVLIPTGTKHQALGSRPFLKPQKP